MPENSGGMKDFPEGFLWGSATSPTQNEGCTKNEWAGFVARDGGRADDGCRAWEDFERDFELLPAIGLNAFRLGLDWGRLQNAPFGELDGAAADQYRRMLDWLRSRGIEPFVTLFHFACPAWMAEQGGWVNPDAPRWFADFAERAARLRLPVRHWITVNEPGVYLVMTYVLGLFPPHGRFAFRRGWTALRHLIRGHHLVRAALRRADAAAQTGITKHFKYFLPHRPFHPLDRLNAWLCKRFFSARMLEAFLADGGCDFIGVNYYGRMRVRGFRDVSPVSGTPREHFEQLNVPCDDMWEQDPEWMIHLLPDLTKRYGLPLFITESGFATGDEELRVRLFRDHVEAMRRAMEAGADIRGYFYWSLTDNFEWNEGYTKKFGLAGIDFTLPDRPRTLRPIAQEYSRLIGKTLF